MLPVKKRWKMIKSQKMKNMKARTKNEESVCWLLNYQSFFIIICPMHDSSTKCSFFQIAKPSKQWKAMKKLEKKKTRKAEMNYREALAVEWVGGLNKRYFNIW